MMDINNSNYCDQAEKVIQSIGRQDRYDPNRLSFNLTTSKIRNLLSLVNQIYNDVVLSKDERLNEQYISQITYLRVRMVYEAGREESVRNFLDKSGLLDQLKKINGDRGNFILFCRYFEALVAYHRFFGGKDK